MKQQIPLAAVGAEVQRLLADVQRTLFRDARAEQERRTLRDPKRGLRNDTRREGGCKSRLG
jgi:hypothetical protein